MTPANRGRLKYADVIADSNGKHFVVRNTYGTFRVTLQRCESRQFPRQIAVPSYGGKRIDPQLLRFTFIGPATCSDLKINYRVAFLANGWVKIGCRLFSPRRAREMAQKFAKGIGRKVVKEKTK
jgi:hypothetical protein